MKNLSILAIAILLAVSCGSHKLFKDGQSDYTIVVSEDATPSEKYAASELRNWIKEVSGVELPVAGLDGGKKGKRLQSRVPAAFSSKSSQK